MRTRDHRAEYARRIAKGTSKGFSRSQSRGHAKAAEAPLRHSPSLSDERVRFALSILRRENSIAKAAREAKISTERLRKYAVEKKLIEKSGRRWRLNPTLPRRVLILSKKRAVTITVGDAETASFVGRYASAVGQFLATNRKALLDPFIGHGVRDRAGKFHPFETDPNTLYRLSSGGEASFEQIYRIIF